MTYDTLFIHDAATVHRDIRQVFMMFATRKPTETPESTKELM